MRRHRNYAYKERFDRLWGALAVCDSRAAGEMTPELVSGIIGCSVDYAQRLLFGRLRLNVRIRVIKKR